MQRWITLVFATLMLFILSGLLTAQAEGIYKSVDANGNTVYSDEPSSGAQSVNLPPQVIAPAATNNNSTAPSFSTTPTKVVVVPTYTQFALISPLNDQTVWDNNGNVTVIVNLTPTLAAIHTLQMVLDGKVVASSQSTTSFALTGLERGTHVLQAQIIDDKKRVINVSNVVTFYLHKAIAACNMPLKTCLDGNCHQEVAYLGDHPNCQNILRAQLAELYQTYLVCQQVFCPLLEKEKLRYELAQKKVDFQIKQAKQNLQTQINACKDTSCPQLAILQQKYQTVEQEVAAYQQQIKQEKANAKARVTNWVNDNN